MVVDEGRSYNRAYLVINCVVQYVEVEPTALLNRHSVRQSRERKRFTNCIITTTPSISPPSHRGASDELARRRARQERMACRRQNAWSTATFMDAVLSGFITPFGPLLLLYFLHQSSTGDSNSRDEANYTVTQVTLQWITAARLWSQVKWQQ